MATSVDNFKSKLADYKNKLNKLKSDYKLSNPKRNLSNEEKGNLKFKIEKFKKDLSNFKKEYLDSNYRSVLSEFEDENRKDELDNLLAECNTIINNHCKGEYVSNLREEDFKDQEFSNPYEQLLYQKRKLEEQDELINSMISKNEENKGIGKEVKNNLKEQNKKITKIGVSLDQTQNEAKKLNDKFVYMIFDSSFWKLYIIIGVLALVLIWLWL